MLSEDSIYFILKLIIYYHWAWSRIKVSAISTSLDIRLESGDMENRVQSHKILRQGQFVKNLTNPLHNMEKPNPPMTQFEWTTQIQMFSTQQNILVDLKR